MGDRKPSHLLNDFRRIGGPNQDEGLIKALWLQRLPVEVQTILASQKTGLTEMADLADTVMETFRFHNQRDVFKVNADAKVHENSTLLVVKELQELVHKLGEQINTLQLRMDRTSRNNDNSSRSNYIRSRSSSRSRRRNFDENSTECWYHQIWKDQADKCISPCSYPKNS